MCAFLAALILFVSLASGSPLTQSALGQTETPDSGQGELENANKGSEDDTSDDGILGGLETPKDKEDKKNEEKESEDIKNGEKPPLKECGRVDVECWGTNQLIKFIWWAIRAPVLALEKLITGFEGMGFALPDPSGPLTDKYAQVAEKVRPLVLVGMLLLGALMMARPHDYNSQYLLQIGLPRIGIAVLGLAFFPTLASTIADISNGLAQSFYKDAEVTATFSQLLTETVIAQIITFLAVLTTPAGWTLLGIMAVILLLPILLVVLVIFVITYLNALFFSLLVLIGPVALACYAVPNLQSITETWFKGILATAILPVIFSIEIMLLSWVIANPEAVGAGKGTAGFIVSIMLLILMFKTPGKVYHWAFGGFGGGGGGGFLAGMGMRSIINKGLQVAAGAGTGGAGAAAAGAAGAGAAGAAGVAGGASAGKVIRNAADTYSKNSNSGWGKGRLAQHAGAHNSRSALKSIQNEPGAMHGIKDAGKSHVAAESRKEELQAEVLGGKLDPKEAAKQKEAIDAHQAESKQTLADNLARTQGAEQGGKSSEDYANLIDAESQAQENGQGSQVAGLTSPHATDSGVDEAAQQSQDTANSQDTGHSQDAQTPEDELQSYTACIDENETNSEAASGSQAQAGDEQRNQRVSSEDGTGGQSNEDSGEMSGEGLKSSQQQSENAGTLDADTGSNSGHLSKGVAAGAAAGAAAAGAGAASGTSTTGSAGSKSAAQKQPGDSGYSPQRFTKNKLSDADKEKAKRLNKFIASNPEAKRQYDMALKDDKAQRNKQGSIHNQAMKGSISQQQAKAKAGGHQSHRNQILNGAKEDLHSRYHDSMGGNHTGPPMSPSDVGRIVGARFDHAYDHPQQHNDMWRSQGHENPSFGPHSNDRMSGSGSDGGSSSGAGFEVRNDTSSYPPDSPDVEPPVPPPDGDPSFRRPGGREDRR